MESKKLFDKMSSAPWKMEELGGGHNFSIVEEETGIHLCNVGDDHILSKLNGYLAGNTIHRNATAIVSAINGTYGKGINPDAVEDMLVDLKALVRHFDNLDPATAAATLINNAKITINKSKII